MAATKYTYSVSTDTVNGAVDSDTLETGIRTSAILTALDYLAVTGDVLDIWFKAALSTSGPDDVALLTSVVGAHTGVSAAKEPDPVILSNKATGDNRLRVAVEKSDLSSVQFYSHNWCDKTTWYSEAVRVVDEVATNSGDNLTYTLVNTFLIDNFHGKLTDEDYLLDSSGNSFRIGVKVDGVVHTERDPHYNHMGDTTHGDYVVDYVAGSITFHEAHAPDAVITVTYHYAVGSSFRVEPAPGKKLQLNKTEVQFSSDLVPRDTTIFITYGYVEVFAPQLVDNPYPVGTQIPISTKRYKTMQNYQDDSMKSYPTVPPMGDGTWRGLGQPVQVFDWDYQRSLTLNGKYGMYIEIQLEHNEPFGGSYGTVTLYCATEDEDET